MVNRLKELLFAVFFGFAVAMIVYVASQTVLYWPFLNIQNRIDDSHFLRRFMIRGADKTETDNIVIVDIDDKTIKSLGNFKFKGWPRRYPAKVFSILKSDGAKLIFLDVIFEGRTRDSIELADSTKNAGNVIAGYYFNLDAKSKNHRPLDPIINEQFSTNMLGPQSLEKNQFIKATDVNLPNYDFVRSVRALGFTNYIPDPDGILRHIPLYIAYGSRLSPSVSLQIWMQLKGIHYSKADISHRGIRFGNIFIPTDKHCFMRLNFKSSGSVYPYVSFLDVMQGNFEPGIFRDKVVMIGSSAKRLGDLKRIPGYGSLPGVEVHATALSTLLNEDYLTVLSGNMVIVISILCGILTSVLFSFTHPFKVGLPVAVGTPLIMYVFSVYAFVEHSFLINISLPSFIILLLYFVVVFHRFMERYESEHVHRTIT